MNFSTASDFTAEIVSPSISKKPREPIMPLVPKNEQSPLFCAKQIPPHHPHIEDIFHLLTASFYYNDCSNFFSIPVLTFLQSTVKVFSFSFFYVFSKNKQKEAIYSHNKVMHIHVSSKK
jgi:hypothetical protein